MKLKINYIYPHIIGLVLLFAVHTSLFAQTNEVPRGLEGVGVTEKLGDYVSGDITLFNEKGEEVTLQSIFDKGRPVVLAPIYYECPMLCNLILNGVMQAVEELQWTPGVEYEVVAFSFAPDETPELAANQKLGYMQEMSRQGIEDGIHFMTAEESQIKKLTDEIGFGYVWDEKTQEYLHGSSIVFLSKEGRISRYLNGIDYPEFLMRNALYDAADGRIGSTIDRMVLFCYQYDAAAGSYVPVAMNIMKLGGAFTLVILGLFLGILWYRERKTLQVT